jgi:tRNA(Ile)-lysidine synthetase-like protein
MGMLKKPFRLPRLENDLWLHWERFQQEHPQLQPPEEGQWAISVSGGVDSMLLWFMLNHAYPEAMGRGTIIFFDHQTRTEEINAEWDVVQKAQRAWGKGETVLRQRLEVGAVEEANFEARARSERQKFWRESFFKKVFLGHHLDDAFEWHLRQWGRATTLRSLLGMPLYQGIFVRPFFCLTKRQIRYFAHFFRVPFCEDSSNANVRFERNRLRADIVPRLKKEWPKMLAHFVVRQQELHRLLKERHTFKTTPLIWQGEECGRVMPTKIMTRENFEKMMALVAEDKVRGKSFGQWQKLEIFLQDPSRTCLFGPLALKKKMGVLVIGDELLCGELKSLEGIKSEFLRVSRKRGLFQKGTTKRKEIEEMVTFSAWSKQWEQIADWNIRLNQGWQSSRDGLHFSVSRGANLYLWWWQCAEVELFCQMES